MPCHLNILTPYGLQAADYTAKSLAEAALHEPADGVYTVANTYNTYQVLKFDAHLDRLERSAQLEGITLKLNRGLLRAALREMITRSAFGNVRFRVTVPAAEPDNLILSIEPFTPPTPELIKTGVHCITVADQARPNPEAKSTGWMHQRSTIQRPEGIYEVFLRDASGYILEGTGSNFYAIVDDVLHTAGEGILYGISRQIVLEVAAGIVPVQQKPIHIDDLARVSEVFLSSSSRGIIPVVKLDDEVIGEGVSGPKSLALRQAYDAWVEAHLEDL